MAKNTGKVRADKREVNRGGKNYLALRSENTRGSLFKQMADMLFKKVEKVIVKSSS